MKSHAWLGLVLRQPGFTPTQRAVAAALWSFMDMHGKCYPSMQALGERAGIAKRDHLRSALDALVDLGHLERSIQPKGRLSTNIYRAVDHRRRPRSGVTTVTLLREIRRPRRGVPLGPPAEGSLTTPIELRGGSDETVTNVHPVISHIAANTRIP